MLVWPREVISKTLSKNPNLVPALDAVINLDVTQKLFRVGDTAISTHKMQNIAKQLGYKTKSVRGRSMHKVGLWGFCGEGKTYKSVFFFCSNEC